MSWEPQPNQNWEYLKLWNQAEQIGMELMDLNAYIISQNHASPEADKRIEELLQTLHNSHLGSIAGLFLRNALTRNKSTTEKHGLKP